jgi:hypothetical protein
MQALVAWLDAGLSREVITYNLDRLLEKALEKKSWKDVPPLQGLVRTFKKPGAEGVSVRILHVHGLLHPQGTGGEGIVFSEPDYHRQYGNPYSWSNLAQLNAFTRERCLFVGVSLTDPNMRRLLEAARIARRPTEDNTAADTPAETPYGPKGTKPHFVFLKQTSVKEVRQRLGVAGTAEQQIPGQSPELDETIDLICKLADAARDAALEALGVQVIWSSTFAETITFLDEIRNRLGTQAAGETR